MPSNLKDFMNKNNITSSSRESQDNNRRPPLRQEPFERQNNDFFHSSPNPPSRSNVVTPKYQKSKSECSEELTKILEELDRKDGYMRKIVETHNTAVFKKFNDDYDRLIQQIVRNVENQLRQNKERIYTELKERRNLQLAESKPIRRNMQKLRSEIVSLKEGLLRDSQYRQYISKIVLKDYEHDLQNIQQDIDRLRLPNVEVCLDDKKQFCMKGDINTVVIVRDQLAQRMNPQNLNFAPNTHLGDNLHLNRDQIKRNPSNKG